MYEPGDNAGVKQISDIHFGNFVGAQMLSPGNEHCVVGIHSQSYIS